MWKAFSLAAWMLLALGGAAAAQRPRPTVARPFVGRTGARGGHGGRSPEQNAGARSNQQALARQVRQAFAGVVRRQLSLTDDQAVQLRDVEQRFQQQRNQLQRDERQTRLGLAAAMQNSEGAPDQGKVAQLMDQLLQAQHRRAAILDAEQKDLSTFLTPLQRAMYQALREQLNRRIALLRQNAKADARGEPPPPTR